MNKADIVDSIRENVDVTKKDVNKVLETFFAVIQKEVAKGKSVKLAGFGTFERRDRKEREGRNPKTGEKMTIPSKSFPAFSPSSQFKEIVNND